MRARTLRRSFPQEELNGVSKCMMCRCAIHTQPIISISTLQHWKSQVACFREARFWARFGHILISHSAFSHNYLSHRTSVDRIMRQVKIPEVTLFDVPVILRIVRHVRKDSKPPKAALTAHSGQSCSMIPAIYYSSKKAHQFMQTSRRDQLGALNRLL